MIRRFGCAATAAVCLAPGLAGAADPAFTFVPYVEAGLGDYQLDFDGAFLLPFGEEVVEAQNTFDFNAGTIKLGLVGAYGDFSANLHYRKTGESTDVQVTANAPSIKWTGDREEVSLALGYSLSPALAVFGGYRQSEASGTGTLNSSYSFDHDGFFVGGSYTLDLTATGALSFSLGYAWLDAELAESLPGIVLPKTDGDGSGAKIGASWRDMFNDRWGYSVNAEYFSYDYDVSGARDEIELEADVEERETLFTLGLFYLL